MFPLTITALLGNHLLKDHAHFCDIVFRAKDESGSQNAHSPHHGFICIINDQNHWKILKAVLEGNKIAAVSWLLHRESQGQFCP